MSDGAELSFDNEAFETVGREIVGGTRRAGKKAIRETTKWLELRLADATQAGTPGDLWKAWKSRFYPNEDADPAGIVYLKGRNRTRGAVQFWSQPGEVRHRGGPGMYLAIPLPAAGPQGRGRDLTPGEWMRRTGQKLHLIWRQGKPSLLCAIGGTTNGRTGMFRALTAGTRGRTAQGRGGANPLADAVIPIFVLLRVVKHRNSFAIEPLIEASEGELSQAFFAALKFGARQGR